MADFSKEATKFLISRPSVVAAVSQFPNGAPYIFHRKVGDNVEKANKTAIVLMDGGYSGDPVRGHTNHFKRLRVEMWAGPLRDARGLPINGSEGSDRLNAAYEALDKVFHRTSGKAQLWGSILSIASERIGDLVMYPVSDGEEIMYGTVYYSVNYVSVNQ